MKILIVLTYYHPHWTGLTAYAKRLAEGLAARGHQVTVLASLHNPALPPEEMIHGVRVVRLPVMAHISRGVVMPAFPTTLWRLMRESDVVQAHTPLLETPLIALYGRLLRRPVIVTHQGDLVMPAGAFNHLVERSVTGLMVQGLRLSTRITVHSGDYARHSAFLSPFSHKLDCIYPPVEIPLPDRQAAAAWKHDLGLGEKRLVGFAGRWVEEKGFDYLLQAIPAVLQAVPEAHFVYAGDPNVVYEDFFQRCQRYLDPVRQHVTMVGLITDPAKLANFYAMCDLFALPSRTDCFPSVQIEALLCGTPLVSTAIPGAREVVQVTGMGVLAPPHDPAGIAASIVEVLRHRDRYVHPRQHIESVFSVARSVDEYESLMASLCRAGN
jgi:glycosyltransferase involved in cell wall biosynthesis